MRVVVHMSRSQVSAKSSGFDLVFGTGQVRVCYAPVQNEVSLDECMYIIAPVLNEYMNCEFWAPSHAHSAVTVLTATALVARDTDAAEASVHSGAVGNVGQCSCCFVGWNFISCSGAELLCRVFKMPE